MPHACTFSTWTLNYQGTLHCAKQLFASLQSSMHLLLPRISTLPLRGQTFDLVPSHSRSSSDRHADCADEK